MLENNTLVEHYPKQIANGEEEAKKTAQKEMKRERRAEILAKTTDIGVNAIILCLLFCKLDSINELPAPVNFLLSGIALRGFNKIPEAARSVFNKTRLFLTKSGILNSPQAHYDLAKNLLDDDHLEAAFTELRKVPKYHSLYQNAQRDIYNIGIAFYKNKKSEFSKKGSKAYYQECLERTQFLLNIAERIDNVTHRESILMYANFICKEALDYKGFKEQAQKLDNIIIDKRLETCCTEMEHCQVHPGR